MQMLSISRLLVAVVAVVSLAACSGGLVPGGSSSKGSQDSSVSTKVPKGKVTLRLAYTDLPPMIKELAAAYHKKHPNVTIKPQYTQFTDYVKSAKLSLSSDNPPDIAQFNPGAMQSSVAAGTLRPLDAYSDAYGWQKEMPKAPLDQLTIDKTGKVFGKGSLYAVPAGLSLVGVYYNKKLARQAGITSPPTTLAEFEKDLGKAKAAGQTPLMMGGLDYGALHLWAELLNVQMPAKDYRTWVFGHPGGTIKTPGAEKAATMMRQWTSKGYINKSANGTSETDSAAKFTQGKATFTVNGNWSAGDIAKGLGKDVGFFTMPAVQAGGNATGSGSSYSYAISDKSKHADVAANFLDFMTSSEAAAIEAKAGALPINAKATPKQEGVLGDITTGYQKVAEDNGYQPFPDFAAPAMLDKLTSGLQNVTGGRTSSSAYLDSLQGTWTSYHG